MHRIFGLKEGIRMIYFIRHGEPDYSESNTKIYQGFGINLSPLSDTGIQQAKKTARDPKLKGANVILSSPYTRALQTAAIISKEIGAEIAIETDLHEWLANKNYIYDNEETNERNYQQYECYQGKYPEGKEMIWESTQKMKERVLAVLKRYERYKKVIVVCHGMIIQAVTESRRPDNGEIVEFNMTN